MGRTRSFDEAEVVGLAAGAFRSQGYEGTGVDALVGVTGLHRGSLYKAFGSKRGLFLAALTEALEHRPFRLDDLDLVLVAALELAPRDREVRERLAARLDEESEPERLLGRRLLSRAELIIDGRATARHPERPVGKEKP